MATLGKDPVTGRITLDGVPLERWDPRLWGTSGRNIFNTQDAQGRDVADPRYYQVTGHGTDSEGGGGQNPIYSLRPEYAQRVGNRVQLGQSGVGGYGEITDEGLATAIYDPELGILVDPRYIKEPDDRVSRIAGPLIMAALGGAAMSGMGLGAAGEGSSAVDALAGAGSDVEALALQGVPADGFGGISGMEGMGGIDGLTSAQSGLGFEGQSLFGPGGLAPEEMGLANYGAGPGLPGTELSWLDRLTNALPNVANALPGITQALSPQQPARAGGGGGAGASGVGAGSHAAQRVQIESNPWLKAQPRDVLSLMTYMGGKGR